MSQVIVIDLPAVEWRPIRPVAESPASAWPILSLLLAISFLLLIGTLSAGGSLALASIIALGPVSLALAMATGELIMEVSRLWTRNYF